MIDRLMNYVSPEPNSGCWLWFGSRNQYGYGQMFIGGKIKMAHRLSYELHKGPIPAALEVDHKCMVKCCVNPDHLEAVTAKENSRRAMVAGVGGAAKKKNQTHCIHGHEFIGENVIFYKRGTRNCRACKRIAKARNKY